MCFVYLVTDICQEQLVNWGPAKQTWAVTGAPESWNGTSCWVRDNTPLFSFFSVVAFNVARLSVLLCSPIELPVSILGRPVAVVAQRRNMYICIQTRPSTVEVYTWLHPCGETPFYDWTFEGSFCIQAWAEARTFIGEHETHSDSAWKASWQIVNSIRVWLLFMDPSFWQLVTLRQRLCSFLLLSSGRLMRRVMVYTLTCTGEAFCTFLVRNRYNCQATCRTAAAVWVQSGDTQLYVCYPECKHRQYYASPVKSAERGENCRGNDLNCLIGSIFTLYLLLLFSPLLVASFVINISRRDDHSVRRVRAVVLCPLLFFATYCTESTNKTSGVQMLKRLSVWDCLAKGTCESEAHHFSLHYFYLSVVQEDAECIIHICDCTCEGMHAYFPSYQICQMKQSICSVSRLLPSQQFLLMTSDFDGWIIPIINIAGLLCQCFLLMTRLCRWLDKQWHGSDRVQTCATLVTCSGMWVTDESSPNKKAWMYIHTLKYTQTHTHTCIHSYVATRAITGVKCVASLEHFGKISSEILKKIFLIYLVN